MSYATYLYYTNVYMGDVLTAETFDRAALRASDYIDTATMGRAANYADSDSVKKACCAIAELMQAKSTASVNMANGEIASESVGSHSVSYRSGAEAVSSIDAQIKSALVFYLANTGLLYRGVPCIRRIP